MVLLLPRGVKVQVPHLASVRIEMGGVTRLPTGVGVQPPAQAFADTPPEGRGRQEHFPTAAHVVLLAQEVMQMHALH